MKRTGHLYEKLFDIKNITKALLDTCKGKGKRRIVQKILKNPKRYALIIKMTLILGFKPTEPKRFQRKDAGSGKIRDITSVPLFPDQVIHRLCVNIMMGPLTKGMDPFCVGCVPKRGCSKGMKTVRRWARKHRKQKVWILKSDIRHFYASIDRGKLLESLSRKIKDRRMLDFLKGIISIDERGLSIGVYSSPWLANFLLEPLDHLLKQEIRVMHLTRNVDDYVWMDTNRRRLLKAKMAADAFLSGIGLKLKDDWRIYRLSQGDVDYVGYRIHERGKVTIRKRTWRKLRRDCLIAMHHRLYRKRARSILSRMGFAMNSDGVRIFRDYLTPGIISKAKAIANAGRETVTRITLRATSGF